MSFRFPAYLCANDAALNRMWIPYTVRFQRAIYERQQRAAHKSFNLSQEKCHRNKHVHDTMTSRRWNIVWPEISSDIAVASSQLLHHRRRRRLNIIACGRYSSNHFRHARYATSLSFDGMPFLRRPLPRQFRGWRLVVYIHRTIEQFCEKFARWAFTIAKNISSQISVAHFTSRALL